MNLIGVCNDILFKWCFKRGKPCTIIASYLFIFFRDGSLWQMKKLKMNGVIEKFTENVKEKAKIYTVNVRI